MTTIYADFLTCAVCHEVSEFQIMGSTSTFGSYDLDLRAPRLARYTMGSWLQDCPECGYVNGSVENLVPGAAEVVRSAEFAALRHDAVTPKLVSAFKRHALIDRLLPHPAITDGIYRALRFHAQLISRQDAECYTCEEAFEAVAERGPSSTRGDRR